MRTKLLVLAAAFAPVAAFADGGGAHLDNPEPLAALYKDIHPPVVVGLRNGSNPRGASD